MNQRRDVTQRFVVGGVLVLTAPVMLALPFHGAPGALTFTVVYASTIFLGGCYLVVSALFKCRKG